MNSERCKSYLQKKIKINMRKWKDGRWKSQKQALAVSYSQMREYCARSKKARLRYKSNMRKSNPKKRSNKKKSTRS
jgi:hypothetical protein